MIISGLMYERGAVALAYLCQGLRYLTVRRLAVEVDINFECFPNKGVTNCRLLCGVEDNNSLNINIFFAIITCKSILL